MRTYRRPVLLTLAGIFAVLPLAAASGVEATVSTPEGRAVTAARQLIAQGSVPAELEEPLGYFPTQQDGFALKPEGECSSPVPLPVSFESACQTHDLGYDLLRFAEAEGEKVPPGLRETIDEQFFGRISANCESFSCHTMATLAAVGVQLNTLRQGGGAPVEEDWPWSR
ncbi:hypothetical protein [Corynebacterium sp. A21]|uniref:hypothetical protein n=1 Tax=Corynebacterium sp. A21 TaxID=3457318 RepID=UPI003FCFDA48